jgi:hypothetical protein
MYYQAYNPPMVQLNINWSEKLEALQNRHQPAWYQTENGIKCATVALRILGVAQAIGSVTLAFTFTATPLTVLGVVGGLAFGAAVCWLAARSLYRTDYSKDPAWLVSYGQKQLELISEKKSWRDVKPLYNECSKLGILDSDEINAICLTRWAQESESTDAFFSTHGCDLPINPVTKEILQEKFFAEIKAKSIGWLATSEKSNFKILTKNDNAFRLKILSLILQQEIEVNKSDYSLLMGRNGETILKEMSREQLEGLRQSCLNNYLELSIRDIPKIVLEHVLDAPSKLALLYNKCDLQIVAGCHLDRYSAFALVKQDKESEAYVSARKKVIEVLKTQANLHHYDWISSKCGKWIDLFEINALEFMDVFKGTIDQLKGGNISFNRFYKSNQPLIKILLNSSDPSVDEENRKLLQNAFLRMSYSLQNQPVYHQIKKILFGSDEAASDAIKKNINKLASNLNPQQFLINCESVLQNLNVLDEPFKSFYNGVLIQFEAFDRNIHDIQKASLLEKNKITQLINQDIANLKEVAKGIKAKINFGIGVNEEHLKISEKEYRAIKGQYDALIHKKEKQAQEKQALVQKGIQASKAVVNDAQRLSELELNEGKIRKNVETLKQEIQVLEGGNAENTRKYEALTKLHVYHQELNQLKEKHPNIESNIARLQKEITNPAQVTGLAAAVSSLWAGSSEKQRELNTLLDASEKMKRLTDDIKGEPCPTNPIYQRAKDSLSSIQIKKGQLAPLESSLRELTRLRSHERALPIQVIGSAVEFMALDLDSVNPLELNALSLKLESIQKSISLYQDNLRELRDQKLDIDKTLEKDTKELTERPEKEILGIQKRSLDEIKKVDREKDEYVRNLEVPKKASAPPLYCAVSGSGEAQDDDAPPPYSL